jgi:hypothetical protein
VASAAASAEASAACSDFEQAVKANAKARAMMVLFRDMGISSKFQY